MDWRGFWGEWEELKQKMVSGVKLVARVSDP